MVALKALLLKAGELEVGFPYSFGQTERPTDPGLRMRVAPKVVHTPVLVQHRKQQVVHMLVVLVLHTQAGEVVVPVLLGLRRPRFHQTHMPAAHMLSSSSFRLEPQRLVVARRIPCCIVVVVDGGRGRSAVDF